MSFRAALAFFTRLPAGCPTPPPPVEGVMPWLPAVGVVVGALSAGAAGLASLILPPLLCGVVGCLAWTMVTGGLHLDGVADCGDGMLLEASPERRLEVMRDSRLGAFGGMALFFVLAMKTASLAVLAERTRADGMLPLFAGCCLAGAAGRCLALAAARLPSARPGGLGDVARRGISRRHEAAAVIVAVVLAGINGLPGLCALGAACAAGAMIAGAASRRLGGVTGDVCGCVIECAECAVLAALCAS